MKLMAPVRYAFTVAFAVAFLPSFSTAGVTLHLGSRSSWLPVDYQLTPCGHKCAPGDPPKVPTLEKAPMTDKSPTPCGCAAESLSPCGRKRFLSKADEPSDKLQKAGPPDDVIAPGSIVRLVDDRDRLLQFFAGYVPPGYVAPPAAFATDTPSAQVTAGEKPRESKETATSAPMGKKPCPCDIKQTTTSAPMEKQTPCTQPPLRPCDNVQFNRVSSSAPAPAVAGAPAAGPAASPAASPSAAPSPAGPQTCAASYVPEMDTMLGKDFVVKEFKDGCVGVPSPDGTQSGVWYFPPASLKLWKKTDDGQAPALSKLARKFLGDPQYGELEVVPPGRYEAPWDYQVKGWSLLKPVAPHMQDYVDFKKTALRLPAWAKVNKTTSVDCMEKMHADPTYVCAEEAVKRNFKPDTVIHEKVPRSRMVPGIKNTERSMVKSVKAQETAPEKEKAANKKMDVDGYFRSSDSSLSGAQGKAEQRGR